MTIDPWKSPLRSALVFAACSIGGVLTLLLSHDDAGDLAGLALMSAPLLLGLCGLILRRRRS